MAIAFRGVGASRGAAGDQTPELPSGWQVDDFHLLLVESANEAVPAVSAGWTQLSSSPQGTGVAAGTTATRVTAYYRIAQSSDAAPTVDDAGNHTFSVILGWSGVDTSSPIDAQAGGTASSSTSVSFPNVTTTVANAEIIHLFAWATDSASGQAGAATNGNLTSITERLDEGTTAANGGGISVITGTKASVGAIGNTTLTAAAATVQGLITLALKPAGGGSTYTLTAGAGSFTETGQAASTLVGRSIAANAAALVFAGQVASLLRGYTVGAGAGGITLAGLAAAMLSAHLIGASSGAFSLASPDATLASSSLNSFALTAGAGATAWASQELGLLAGRSVAASEGGVGLLGQGAGAFVGRAVVTASGALGLSGQDAGLFCSRVLGAVAGHHAFDALAAALVIASPRAPLLVAQPGQIVIAGLADLIGPLWTPAAPGEANWTRLALIAGLWSAPPVAETSWTAGPGEPDQAEAWIST